MREQDEIISADADEGLRHEIACSASDKNSAKTVSKDEPSEAPAGRRGFSALLAAVACTVLGARLIVISAFGSPVPVLDQWDGEGAVLYSPYLKGTLSVATLFASHNGHRILITRLFALGHLELAGEWNTRLEMIFGAMVLTALVTWLAALLMPLVAPQRRMLLSCFIALAFAFPLDYENTLWGFQSQVYLSLLSGLAALVAFASAAPFSARWFGGLVAGVLAYFAFATGVAALPAAGMLVSLQLATRTRKRCGREVAAVAVMAAVALAMILWGATSTRTMSTLWTFAAGLAIFAALTIVGGVPIALFCRHTLLRRPNISDRAWVVLGLSAWVAVQLILLAYGRGSLVAPRYMDVVLLVYPMALVAVFARSDRADNGGTRGRARLGAVTWLFAVVAAFALAGCMSVLACSYWSKAANQQLADVQSYLASGNNDDLRERGSTTRGIVLNHPFPERQARVLGDPAVRAILPPEVRPPDADNAGARDRMWLKGRLAGATAMTVHLMLMGSPAVLAVGIGLFFAVGAARDVSPSRRCRE